MFASGNLVARGQRPTKSPMSLSASCLRTFQPLDGKRICCKNRPANRSKLCPRAERFRVAFGDGSVGPRPGRKCLARRSIRKDHGGLRKANEGLRFDLRFLTPRDPPQTDHLKKQATQTNKRNNNTNQPTNQQTNEQASNQPSKQTNKQSSNQTNTHTHRGVFVCDAPFWLVLKRTKGHSPIWRLLETNMTRCTETCSKSTHTRGSWAYRFSL